MRNETLSQKTVFSTDHQGILSQTDFGKVYHEWLLRTIPASSKRLEKLPWLLRAIPASLKRL